MGEGLSLEKKSRGMRVRKDPSGTRGTHLSGGGRMRELQLFGAGWALNHHKYPVQIPNVVPHKEVEREVAGRF